jgi:hypothetical protein
MPGFNIGGFGAEGAPPSLIEVRRTHRWKFTTIGPDGGGILANVSVFLQKAMRPSLIFDEPEMHHNQEVIYFAGKHKWEPLTLTWYDVEAPDVSKAMQDWAQKCLTIPQANVAHPQAFKASESKLEMLNGVGGVTETWAIYNGWPSEVKWNGLDYTTSDLQLVEVKFRYDRAYRIR